jgi:hypothetical protein
MRNIGFNAENIVCSGEVLAYHIKKLKSSPEYATTANFPIYLVGSVELQKLLEREGIESFGPGPDPFPDDQVGNSPLLNMVSMQSLG